MRLRLVPHNGRGGGDEAQRELARKVPFDKHPAASDVALAIRTLLYFVCVVVSYLFGSFGPDHAR